MKKYFPIATFLSLLIILTSANVICAEDNPPENTIVFEGIFNVHKVYEPGFVRRTYWLVFLCKTPQKDYLYHEVTLPYSKVPKILKDQKYKLRIKVTEFGHITSKDKLQYYEHANNIPAYKIEGDLLNINQVQ